MRAVRSLVILPSFGTYSSFSHTHTRAHTHTHTHIHTHTHTQSLDLKKEQILLDRTESSLHVNDLSTCIPDSAPRYHFFRFKHTHEGDYQEAIGMTQATATVRATTDN